MTGQRNRQVQSGVNRVRRRLDGRKEDSQECTVSNGLRKEWKVKNATKGQRDRQVQPGVNRVGRRPDGRKTPRVYRIRWPLGGEQKVNATDKYYPA
jgi:hypothetical protein